MELNQSFLAQMREATELLQTSGPAAATAAIQRALQSPLGASTARAEKKGAGLVTVDNAACRVARHE
jgi:hypothetical protein